MYDVGRRRGNSLSVVIQVPHWIPPPVLSSASLPQFIREFCWTNISISIITVTGGRPKCCLILQQTLLQLH